MNERHFWDSIFQQDFEAVTYFLDINPDFDINSILPELNTTPLITAIDSDSVEIVEFILKKGANPNITGNGMSLALNHTIELAIETDDYQPGDYLGLLEMLKLLLTYGANAHLENFNGTTAYEYARNQFLPAIELFDQYIHKSIKKPI